MQWPDSVGEEKAENMVAGQDINFDMIRALGKEKEGDQKEKEDGEARTQDQEQRPRSLSAGASRWVPDSHLSLRLHPCPRLPS